MLTVTSSSNGVNMGYRAVRSNTSLRGSGREAEFINCTNWGVNNLERHACSPL